MLPFPVEYYARETPAWQRWAGWLAKVLLFLVLSGLTLWAAGALYYDFPVTRLRTVAACAYPLIVLLAAIFAKPRLRIAVVLGCFALVLAWWLTVKPSNNRAWQPDVDRTAWAEIDGDRVTIHNVRNFDYRTTTDYTPQWETRTFDLTQLRGVDLFVNYWGINFMAHPILSFQFGENDRVCMSIETRKTVGEKDSMIGGLYRQYELIYLVGDERDIVRLRTNCRKEDVYLYHLRMTPERARTVFLEYVQRINSLHTTPEFYNAITSNCTTNIRSQSGKVNPWDWRILLNGYADKMMYERGGLAGDLPFNELKKRARINQAALDTGSSPDFSGIIREGRPGF